MVTINAMNIGVKLDGLGRYSFEIAKRLIKNDLVSKVVINRKAVTYFLDELRIYKNKICVVPSFVSPDYGFKGHLLRLLYTNALREDILFNTSQIELNFWKKKQIITIHDLTPLLFSQGRSKQFYYFKYILPKFLRRIDKIITDSNHVKDLLMEFYGLEREKIKVIYCGISDIFFTEGISNNTGNYLLYVGRITSTKNIVGILEAFNFIHKNYRLPLRLKITSAGADIIAILRHIGCNEKLLDFIEFIPHPSDAELLNLYKDALAFIFPSLSEGFGIPPLEAMACGCPAVVSDVRSIREICADAAYYVDPYNAESIADGIYRVATDSELRQRLVTKGLQRTRLFSWERAAKEHIKVFEEVSYQ
jgi:glycosyltransferase involved in cell wall biosynthesis